MPGSADLDPDDWSFAAFWRGTKLMIWAKAPVPPGASFTLNRQRDSVETDTITFRLHYVGNEERKKGQWKVRIIEHAEPEVPDFTRRIVVLLPRKQRWVIESRRG